MSSGGVDVTTNSIMTEAREGWYRGGPGGNVSLFCATNITLAGGISTRSGNGAVSGAILIRGSLSDTNARAGNVVIGLSTGIRTDSMGDSNGSGGGNVTIRAVSLQIAGKIDTRAQCYHARTGSVDIDAAESVVIVGTIDTRMINNSFSSGSPGYVKIVGRHIAVRGVDADGCSIRTWPGVLSNPESHSSLAGDADVTLTGIDTSLQPYDPVNPTNRFTSSIVVAGKIEAGRWFSDDAMGKIRIAAVEVQLGGDVLLFNTTASNVLAIRYGITTYGIVTHNIVYDAGLGTLSFTADVPYHRLWGPQGTVMVFR